MSEELFRKEAVESRLLSLQGDVSLLDDTSTNKLVLAAVAVLLALLMWAFTATYSRVEYAYGALSTSRPSTKIHPQRHGVVETLNVGDGTAVQKGQSLFVVNVDVLDSERKSVADSELKSLIAQRALLQSALATDSSLVDVERARLQESISSLERDVGSLRRQLHLQQKIAASAQEVVDRIAPAADAGYVSKIEYALRNQSSQQAHQGAEQLSQAANEAQSRLVDMRRQLVGLEISKASRGADMQLQLQSVEQRLTSAHANVSYSVTAPISGKVTSVQVSQGTRVDPLIPALSIVPEESLYEAVIFVPNTAIGEIKLGQSVSIMYDAFPFKRYGSFEAVIYEVAEHPLAPEEAISSVKLDVPVYRVKARLKGQHVNHQGVSKPLRSGMTFRASIRLDDKTVVSRLLEPFATLSSRF